MPQARCHYMVDFFYPEAGRPDGVRSESGRIVAYDDAEAITESKIASVGARSRFGAQLKPAFFRVRKISRKHEEVIYDSSKEVSNA